MQYSKYINPLLDLSFKKLFGTDLNKDLLLNLLNAVFNGRKDLIDLQYNKNEHHGDNKEEGSVVFDVLCTTNNGEKILIEVQHSRPVNFKKRGIYYTSRLISEQAPKGKLSEWQYDISEVYFIAILDKPEPPGTKNRLTSKDRYVHDVCLCYRETGEIFYDDLGYIYIDLTNFVKTDEECNLALDRWLYELKHMPERDDCPPHLKDTIFGKLYSVGEYANLTREEQKMYDQELKRKWDNAAVLSQAKLEGEAIGEARGQAKGKTEKALEIAQKLRSKDMPVDEIVELTGLSPEEIANL